MIAMLLHFATGFLCGCGVTAAAIATYYLKG